MADTVSATQFDADHDLTDWRYLLDHIDATFRAGSFEAAAALASAIASAAEAVDHHPDIDIRYPDVVHVRLTTHAQNAVTTLDCDLADQISVIADAAGASSEPTTATSQEVAIDASDIAAVRPFWQAVLGYRPVPSAGDDPRILVDPLRIGPQFWFQQMDEPRTERNNLHIDVTVSHDAVQDRLDAALAAGGRLVSDAYAPAFWVLADAEGNEACVCSWQGRD